MAADFGPPPIKTLTVAPIPGSFGQGFPGLVYLSTMSYLSPGDLPVGLRERTQQLFYSELLAAHEVAHQWWGNSVTAAGYQDEWLQEALANYTAMMHVEKRKGIKSIDAVLADYKRHLLAKDENGHVVESAGPITLGIRLQNSQTQNSWRVITYEKGTWIMHMLRKQLGDAAFQKMLGEVARRFRQKPLSNEEFRQIAASYLPPRSADPQLDVFFENWVYSTGIPALRFTPKVSTGLKVSGVITQTGVTEDFEVDVPVEVSFVRGPSQTFWVRTSNEPSEFAFTVRQPAVKVAIGSAILRAD
jgi:aminopeptidase N